MWEGIIVLVCITALGIVVQKDGYNDGYKRGQIDALTGTVKYELVVRPDSTKEWVGK